MRTVEHVKLKSDSNYIPVRYVVMEVTVGSSLATSQAWIKCVSKGCDTEENLVAHKLTKDGYQPVPDEKGHPVKQTEYAPVSMAGFTDTIGEYQVISLGDVEPYNRPTIDFTTNFEIG